MLHFKSSSFWVKALIWSMRECSGELVTDVPVGVSISVV